MEGVRGVQRATLRTFLAQSALQLRHRVRQPGDDAERWAIHGRQPQAFAKQITHALFRQRYGQHHAAGHLLHQPAAQRYQTHAIVQLQHARQAGCHVFANAVPYAGRRFDSPAHPEPRQGQFHDKQRRLRDGRADQAGTCLIAFGVPGVKHFAEVKVEVFLEMFTTFVQHRSEQRFPLIQLEPHVHVLRALTGEHKHDRALFRRRQAGEHPSRITPLQYLHSVVQAVA